MFKGISWSSLLLLGATSAVGLMAGCGDDDDTTTTNTGPTGPSSSSSSDASSSSSSGMGGNGTGGTGGMAAGGNGGMGGAGGAPDFTALASGDVLSNHGFETFTSPGGQPPFDPADSWLTFAVQLNPSFGELGAYNNHATQADGADIFPSTDPFPGLNGTRALKVFGVAQNIPMTTTLSHTLGTVYQEFTAGTLPPVGSQLRLTGWAYHASQDPLGTESQAYLVIKCFGTNFTEQCGAGGQKSTPITSTTAADGWVQYVVDLPATNADTILIQAGVEFEQCLSGTACSGADGAGAVFFDDLVFSYE